MYIGYVWWIIFQNWKYDDDVDDDDDNNLSDI
jgi:hypothetical protein